MSDEGLAEKGSRAAAQEIGNQRSAQKRSASYRKAFEDTEFLNRDELRPVRLQLEMWKPDLIQREHGISSTIVVFGSARVVERPTAEIRLKALEEKLLQNPESQRLQRQVRAARRLLESSRYYEDARKLAHLISSDCQGPAGMCDFVIVTGGGPGIMEASNRGAYEAKAKSIGLNIVLPFEQEPNAYITPDLCFQFHYFATRKMHFLLRAKALVAFPGGYGTFDELFETLTLIQTKKIKPLPVLLYGRSYWERAIDFEFLADEGYISPEDTQLFRFVETPEESWQAIRDFYDLDANQRQD
ncbi:MAG TPA: TIGR00730 family Rossman fold protein [Planctomycetota bacterium]|jgi:uncharacterized protein (TIGR00730 family)|nr:TIGR00730 family Rossman fold protein [Planctomycetota bacterium]